jgi:bacillithiol system protein YtxJ
MLHSKEQLDALLDKGSPDGSPFLIFKHSTRCMISSTAKRRLEREPHPGLSYYLIDVIANRSLSDYLADRSRVRHESPQAFLFYNSDLVDVKSHLSISPNEISKRIGLLLST